MTEYNFRLLFDAPTELSDDHLNRLYEATGADATIGSDSDGWSAEFDRTAPDFITAVMSALGQVERAGFPVRLLASEDDALVNASEIARRTEKSREAIRLYVEGERHRELGDFPSPVATFATGERIWRWGDVAPWLSRAIGKQFSSGQDPDLIKAVNDVLDLKCRMPRLQTKAREAVGELLDSRVAIAR